LPIAIAAEQPLEIGLRLKQSNVELRADRWLRDYRSRQGRPDQLLLSGRHLTLLIDQGKSFAAQLIFCANAKEAD
jgi:hypothetical protein